MPTKVFNRFNFPPLPAMQTSRSLGLLACLFALMGLAMAQSPTTQLNFENAMAYLTYVLLGLSVVGATLTIITFLIFPRIRTYPIKLICWLCTTIAIGQLLFIIVSFTAAGTPWCEPAGALIHFWFMSNFCWVRYVTLLKTCPKNSTTDFF